MAKPSWVTLDKSSGTSSATVNVSASSYTGRVARTGSLTVASTKDTSKKATVSITQTAKTSDVIMSSSSGLNVPQEGGQTQVEVLTNAKYIIFKPTTSNFPAESNRSYFTGPSAKPTTAITPSKLSDGSYLFIIPGDAGASAQQVMALRITFPANGAITGVDYKGNLAISNAASAPTAYPASPGTGEKLEIVWSQKAKVVTLSVSPTSITIPAAGTAQKVTITTNDAWSIS